MTGLTTGQYKVEPTSQQIETAEMIIDQKLDKVELWMEEHEIDFGPMQPAMGVAITDDEMTLVGYFGGDGELIGDWH